jgi:predicted nucleotidyltransferase component of viral defense system
VSMINGSPQYATVLAFRRALEDRLKREAKARARSLEELRREFLFQRFLALIFSFPDGQWVLKGGASLLMRLAKARFSKDLDLLHLGELSPAEAIAELRALTAPARGII